MFPRSFHYHRAKSYEDAAALLGQLGDEAKLLAGGQSLIPLMKLRFANPAHLVDLNFIPNTSYIRRDGDSVRIGAMTRHAELEHSDIIAGIPIVHDCAAGIADVQVRNRGTIGGSVAEADPSGDWAATLLALDTDVHCSGPKGKRVLKMKDFITDAYTSVLAHDELITEISVKIPAKRSGGAYLAFKRCAPVYASAAVAVQLTMDDGSCQDASIYLAAVGLTAVHASAAEAQLRGQSFNSSTIERAAEAARAAADPQPDMRGSAEYKRALVAGLVKRAIDIAARRARGEHVEGGHIYA
ncbi:MAG: xanthine dehydrogenase family protein subunit M [Acidobacteria bacterium]|nr:xanthine dehydrogenase family protein subunit M [Acidobacteriota bacterium]